MQNHDHIPVLINEVLEVLQPEDNKIYVDCTFGAGGYSKKILDAANCNVIGIDRDPDARKYASEIELKYKGRFKFYNKKFSELNEVLEESNIKEIDALILDLGISSMQVDLGERGFSFSKDAKLDMRMSKDGISAYDFVNNEKEEKIAEVLFKFGDEKFSRKIARKIVFLRQDKPIETTFELAEIIRSVMPAKFRGHRTDPATKSFQAIRIWVNDELQELSAILDLSLSLLKIGGKIIVVTFHSTEDRIVKSFFNNNAKAAPVISRYLPDPIDKKLLILELINRKVIIPEESEVKDNVRSRSAKLRAAIKIREG